MAGALQGSQTVKRKALRWPYALLGLFFLAGLGMLGGAGYLIVNTRRDIAAAAGAGGAVIDLIVERDCDFVFLVAL
jgi:hypothetical protein